MSGIRLAGSATIALSAAVSSGGGVPGSMFAGWILPAEGETMAEPASVEVWADAEAVKNAQPTIKVSRDRLIQVFTVFFDANATPEGSLNSKRAQFDLSDSKQMAVHRIQLGLLSTFLHPRIEDSCSGKAGLFVVF
jgi:hypothetical protein